MWHLTVGTIKKFKHKNKKAYICIYIYRSMSQAVQTLGESTPRQREMPVSWKQRSGKLQAVPADWVVGPAAEHQGENSLAVYNSDRIKSQQRPSRSQNEVLNAGKRSGARRASVWRLSHYLLEADRKKKKKSNKSHQAKKVHLQHIRLQLRYHHLRHPRAPQEALAHSDAEHTRTIWSPLPLLGIQSSRYFNTPSSPPTTLFLHPQLPAHLSHLFPPLASFLPVYSLFIIRNYKTYPKKHSLPLLTSGADRGRLPDGGSVLWGKRADSSDSV